MSIASPKNGQQVSLILVFRKNESSSHSIEKGSLSMCIHACLVQTGVKNAFFEWPHPLTTPTQNQKAQSKVKDLLFEFFV